MPCDDADGAHAGATLGRTAELTQPVFPSRGRQARSTRIPSPSRHPTTTCVSCGRRTRSRPSRSTPLWPGTRGGTSTTVGPVLACLSFLETSLLTRTGIRRRPRNPDPTKCRLRGPRVAAAGRPRRRHEDGDLGREGHPTARRNRRLVRESVLGPAQGGEEGQGEGGSQGEAPCAPGAAQVPAGSPGPDGLTPGSPTPSPRGRKVRSRGRVEVAAPRARAGRACERWPGISSPWTHNNGAGARVG
mgnify:CR=1 FL=1